MEFDIEKHRVVGRVDHALKPEFISARVKVIGFLDNSNELCLLDENELVKIFPPKGFIYAYKLLHGSKYEINDIVDYRDWETDRKSTRLNSSHSGESRMPSSA